MYVCMCECVCKYARICVYMNAPLFSSRSNGVRMFIVYFVWSIK